LVPIGMACASAWHPPSSYARGAVICVLLIWVLQLGWTTHYIVRACVESSLAETGKNIVQKIALAFLFTGMALMYILIVLRIEAFQHSMGRSPSRLLRCTVGVHCILLLFRHPVGHRHDAELDPITAALPLLITILAIRAFMVPLLLLRTETSRVRGVPKMQAEWATDALRCELKGLLVLTLTSTVRFCVTDATRKHLVGAWKTARDVVCSIDDVANSLGVAIMSGILQQCGTASLPVVEVCADTSFTNQPVDIWRTDVGWTEKVKDLAGRGFTVASLLEFYERLFDGEVMPSFQPALSTTNDVVRQAVVPMSRSDAGAVPWRQSGTKGAPCSPSGW